MKSAILILLSAISLQAIGQINGNGNLVTKTLDIRNIKKIEINFYADITIDPSIPEGITVTAEENIIDLIDFPVTRAKLDIGQKEWIESSKRIKILIGAPELREVTMASHEEVLVQNLNQTKIKLIPTLGKIVVNGKVEFLEIEGTDGEVDATSLIAENGDVEIDGKGIAYVNVQNKLSSYVDGRGKVITVTEPQLLDGTLTSEDGRILPRNKDYYFTDYEHKHADYIKFTLKNNSWSRKNFVVIGPKKDGHTFSYGFPMMPGQKREKNWSIGSRVYLENLFGKREYLLTITEDNQGQVVKIL